MKVFILKLITDVTKLIKKIHTTSTRHCLIQSWQSVLCNDYIVSHPLIMTDAFVDETKSKIPLDHDQQARKKLLKWNKRDHYQLEYNLLIHFLYCKLKQIFNSWNKRIICIMFHPNLDNSWKVLWWFICKRWNLHH